MQIDLARAEQKKIMANIVNYMSITDDKGLGFLMRMVSQLDEMLTNTLDALESVKAIGILESHGVEIIELDTAPEEAYPCQSYLRNEPQEWVRQNNVDGEK